MPAFTADVRSVDIKVLPPTTFLKNWKCFVICLCVAVSNFQYGFDTGILNGFQAMQGFLRVFGIPSANGEFVIGTTFQQLITSLLQVGLVIASALIGPFAKYFGRRLGIFVASIIACIGITIQILVTSKGPVYLARLLLGIANGFYVNLTVLYLSEVAPTQYRGVIVASFQIFTNIGQFLGAVVSNALHNNLTKLSYQIQLTILYFVPLWLMITVWFLPESPRWLAVQGKESAASRSLTRLRPAGRSAEYIRSELKLIMDAIHVEREIAATQSWLEIWKGSDLRRTLLTIACATFHAASGVNLLVGYGTFFFQIAGTKRPFVNTVILQSISVAASFLAFPLANRFGRRTLLLVGFASTTICMFCIALVYTIAPTKVASGKALVALLCMFLFTYGCTIGPVSWIAAGEMPSNNLRSMTFGVAMSIGFVFAWLTTFTTPFFINMDDLNWGGKVAWIWGPSNLIALVFIFFFLPETKGRSLEELDKLFVESVPARQFKGYRSAQEEPITHNDPQSSMDEKATEEFEDIKSKA